jgi:hypothetical protein
MALSGVSYASIAHSLWFVALALGKRFFLKLHRHALLSHASEIASMRNRFYFLR